MKPALRLTVIAALAILPAGTGWSAVPDAIRSTYTDRVEHAERVFGDVRFVMGSGQAMEWLEMYVGASLVGAYRDFDVQEVQASPDGRYFLAISNTSASSLAFAVLDRKGHVLFARPHDAAELHYCGEPSLKVRHWIDTAAANVRFEQARSAAGSPAREYLKSVMVKGCDGKDVLLGQAADPLEQARPVNRPVLNIPADGVERGQFFIGNTIANLRGLDPTFGGRTLTMIDGRRPASRASPSCANTLRETSASVLVDDNGSTTPLPSHPGTLIGCTSTGTGNEVLLVYRLMKDGRQYNLARVFDKWGVQLAQAELDGAGTVEFMVAGNPYVAKVPGP